MTKRKFVSFFHNNVIASRTNSMFDIKNNKATETPIFARLQKYLQQRNIYLNTFDIPIKGKTFRHIHYDMPYPIPSNFSIWKSIFLNRRKNILIITEPPMVNPFNYMRIFHTFFLKVYTWNDALVDNKKYFKFRLPKVSYGINTRSLKFKNKNFLVLINKNTLPFFPFKTFQPFGRELYSQRIKAIEFFEQRIPKKFALYGRGWNKPKKYNLKEYIFGFKKYSAYRGKIDNKIKLLSKFKYSICFENLTDVKGLISEKIFDCFKARCVPIYWGASNIGNYIPKDCFIDFRDFPSYEKLLNLLESIDENKYNRYIENIERLLSDKKFRRLWFEDGYSKFFLEDVLEIKNNSK